MTETVDMDGIAEKYPWLADPTIKYTTDNVVNIVPLNVVAGHLGVSIPALKDRIRARNATCSKIGRNWFLTRFQYQDLLQKLAEGKQPWEGLKGQVVYAVRYLPAVKIGFTNGGFQGLQRRIAGFKMSVPTGDFETLMASEGTYDQEQRAHTALKHIHMRGEWFRHNGDMQFFLDTWERDGLANAIEQTENFFK